jgi:hypothetical protein
MTHETNLAADKEEDAHFSFCDLPPTQAHINTTSQHPALADLRMTHKRSIDHHLVCDTNITADALCLLNKPQ